MKNVLITGGATGIGSACAKCFAEAGYRVLLHYNSSSEQALDIQQRLCAKGYDVQIYQADISDIDSINNMVSRIVRLYKHIDVLVNNAGISLYSQVQDVTLTQYNTVMDINVRGTYFVSKAVLDNMLSRGSGSIVNVSSVWGLHGGSCESVYTMSKHALVGLTKSLACEMEGSGIVVNCICPTIVPTKMTSHLTNEQMAQFGKKYGVGVASVEDVANKILSISQYNSSGNIEQI